MSSAVSAMLSISISIQYTASAVRCNRSKTSASFSSGIPNTEKRMKARRRRRIAFLVSRCLEPQMKNEAGVFERVVFLLDVLDSIRVRESGGSSW